MTRRVKGVLFLDYVRMLRAHPDRSWVRFLQRDDLAFVERKVDPEAWYPMDVFERLGVAILQVVAGGDLGMVHQWGRISAVHVTTAVDELIVPDDPRESLMRFQVFRRGFFDFEPLTILQITDTSVELEIAYGMSDLAEQAASIQTMGFFEGLVELAGGTGVQATFAHSRWRGAPRTVLRVAWSDA
ncbi:MAG TPA: hypothetical protein VII13_18515 [Vicinamibacteria bacterium]|jgi:hypothetical protein